MIRKVIFTADDFGLDPAVNEAVERAYCDGVLTSASLMVTAPAAADAVERAKRLPGLAVGLHLVLVQGRSALPASPMLTDAAGEFPTSPAQAGLRYFFRPGMRAALAKEIRAQFEAYRATGLPLDHVDGHTHLHIHPTIFSLLLEIGPEYGMQAMRIPYEPPLPSWRAAGTGLAGRLGASLAFYPWGEHMRRALRNRGIACNDATFGLHDSGRMTQQCLVRQLEQLPEREVTEIYCHPAVRQTEWLAQRMPGYRNVEEFQALVSSDVRALIDRLGYRRIAYRDLPAGLAAQVPSGKN
jgi:hopanoid biosynthesis associated protein HpnK